MTKKFTPARWAIDISKILNAIQDYNRFPVNVADVAKEISRIKFPDDPITLIKGKNLPGFEGGMKRAPAGKVGWGIFYNTAITSKGRINFTLAHEFGHYLLHRIDHPDGFMCSTEDMARWDSEYGRLEGQANEFAANLLMPLDDFRKNINAKDFPTLDNIGDCAKRYAVSLIAAILRWLSYTTRRAVMVISREGFVLWSRSSNAAMKSKMYLKTSGMPPIAVPNSSLACQKIKIDGHTAFTEHDRKVWFDKPCKEQVLFSDQYDFTISLLYFDDSARKFHVDEEEAIQDALECFEHRTSSQS